METLNAMPGKSGMMNLYPSQMSENLITLIDDKEAIEELLFMKSSTFCYDRDVKGWKNIVLTKQMVPTPPCFNFLVSIKNE